MKTSWIYWGLGLVVLYMVLSKKKLFATGTSGAAGTLVNTNTHTTAPPPWTSNASGLINSVLGTNSTVGQEVSSGLNFVGGLFGNSTPASGSKTPSSSGSGTGVVNTSQAGDNSGLGSPNATDMGSPIPVNVGYDQYGMTDFGGN